MSAHTYTTLTVTSHDDWASVFLARPDVRNAFNEVMISELQDAFSKLGARTDLRALVLGGQGDVFCAGADVDWMRRAKDRTETDNVSDARAMAEMFRTLDECPLPVIARVQKAAFGGALGLIAGSDIVVAEAGTRMAFSEVRLGIVPAVISSFTVARIGLAQARRYFLTGEVFAAEAAPAGLVHEVVPAGGLDSKVTDILSQLREAAPGAVREIKKLLRDSSGLPRADVLELCARTIARVRVGEEARAGLSAFLDRKAAPWSPKGQSGR